ncbi:hypothetical protein CLV62_11484 [Dysgonomonas alginatilytica]|uniref:Uncharacterized protein n=1 Tax=Dysgonomonas alginatilytica TaxID=1605892 RepID=A0A2V3PPR2_9BACT|nr:hypothetical protein [Dysgonomonas alginatilytica]PXV63367.1 hypothetical protein CLV62_11484 [Dysgonomonas alginatilytica]
MKKSILTCILFALCLVNLQAQVGINTSTPNPSAALDVVSPNDNQGVLIPRMTTAQKIAISNPAPGLLVYDTTSKCISQNAGTGASPIWVCLSQKDNQSGFFYMPSIAVDASTIGVVATPLDLYAEYKKQFSNVASTARSVGSPASIPYFPAATDLYYYITYYDDTTLKINSISADGKVSYQILQEADYKSFMNIVFVVK